MEEVNIQGRLAEGLKAYNLSMEEIKEGGWFYCGGDHASHLDYWNLRNETRRLLKKKPWSFPPKEDHCVCGHFIKHNCYITNKKFILVVGNCCIKRFLTSKERTCEVCRAPHKNRKYNLCDNHRALVEPFWWVRSWRHY
jgi:hypothetical protein